MSSADPLRRGCPLVAFVLSFVILISGCTSADDAADSAPTPSVVEEASGLSTTDRWSIGEVLAAESDCGSPATGRTIAIGYAADLSDGASAVDRVGADAATELVDMINCSGGVEGRALSLEIVDVSGDPVDARRAVDELLEDGVLAVLGPSSVEVAFRVLEATAGRVPVIFPDATEPALADLSRLSYLVLPDDITAAGAAAEFAIDQGWRSAITFTAPGPYYETHARAFADAYRASGGTVAETFEFTVGETAQTAAAVDFVERLGTAERPEVMYTVMSADQLVEVHNRFVEVGLDLAVLTGSRFEADGGYAEAALDGVYHLAPTVAEFEAGLAALDESVEAVSESEPASILQASLVGDALSVVIDAYLRAADSPELPTPDGAAGGSHPSPVAVGQAIASGGEIEGVTGTLRYEGRAIPSRSVVVLRVDGGEPVLVAEFEL